MVVLSATLGYLNTRPNGAVAASSLHMREVRGSIPVSGKVSQIRLIVRVGLISGETIKQKPFLGVAIDNLCLRCIPKQRI